MESGNAIPKRVLEDPLYLLSGELDAARAVGKPAEESVNLVNCFLDAPLSIDFVNENAVFEKSANGCIESVEYLPDGFLPAADS